MGWWSQHSMAEAAREGPMSVVVLNVGTTTTVMWSMRDARASRREVSSRTMYDETSRVVARWFRASTLTNSWMVMWSSLFGGSREPKEIPFFDVS